MNRRDVLKMIGAGSMTPLMHAGVSNTSSAEKTSVARYPYELVVYGATPAGIACAVRAAREGLSVLLVEHSPRVGGMFSSGLSVMDTLYAGARAPVYDEFRWSIHDFYRTKYGPDSAQFAASRPGHPKTYYEVHVAERLLAKMIDDEPGITLRKGFYPVSVERDGAVITEATFQKKHGSETFSAKANIFADCSYEGDLMAAAKVPYRVGRESRSEFNEEHAGKIFLKRIEPWPPAYVDPHVISDYKPLNLFHYDRWFEIDRARSTGEGDHLIQAYNMRTVLCSDPENRVIPTAPPAGYNREEMADIWSKKPQYSQLLGPLPNQKWLWNMPELIGPQNPYPDGDWTTREAVTARHRLATESMLYFLQNDASLSEATHKEWRNLGYAKDEFQDNGHLPYEVYARETRRMKGRKVFTENDARLHGVAKRTPVQRDSIGITEWFMDVHACAATRYADTLSEGEIYLNYISHPAQVSYQTMLPEGTDNLLVPVCLSCTHIGWGAIRLEPTWMSLGESAGHAAALAIQRGISPARVNTDELVRRLAERRLMVSFFNDVSIDAAEPWVVPVQYFGTQGFFGSYDARPAAPLTEAVAKIWVQSAGEWLHHVSVDASARSLRVLEAERADSAPVTAARFMKMLGSVASPASVSSSARMLSLGKGSLPIYRGNACRLIYALAGHRHTATA